MEKGSVEVARAGYAAGNLAYESGDVRALAPFLERHVHSDVVLTPSGLFPETAEMHGHEGVLRFTQIQMEAFQRMWVEPEEFIEAEDRVVVPLRLGGRARHTGLEIELSIFHVWTFRDGKVARLDVYQTQEEALSAAGLSE